MLIILLRITHRVRTRAVHLKRYYFRSLTELGGQSSEEGSNNSGGSIPLLRLYEIEPQFCRLRPPEMEVTIT